MFKFFTANHVNYRLLRDMGLNTQLTKSQLVKIYEEPYSYIMLDIHPKRVHSQFNTVRSDILSNYFRIFRMEDQFIAVPKSIFLKHFKIIEGSGNSQLRVIRDHEIEIKKKSNKHKRKEYRNSSTESEETTESDDSDRTSRRRRTK